MFAAFSFLFVLTMATGVFASFTNLTINAPYGTTVYQAACNKYTYFRVVLSDPCLDLNVSVVSTSGDPKIYVSRDYVDGSFAYPTSTDQSWAVFKRTRNHENLQLIISHWDPNMSPGNFDIGVFNDCSDQHETANFQIAVTTFADDTLDILKNPALSRNQFVKALDYDFFQFCVPVCADVTVTLQNCLDSTECPTSYSYPELLTSRTKRHPRLHDYSWKLASVVRRSNYILHDDSSARDNHGYIAGTYYVGVYGWCTPEQYVVNNATDGPCAYAANTQYNVTVSYNEFPDATCHAPITLPDISSYPVISADSHVEGTVACNNYTYYTLRVPQRCVSVNFFVDTTSDPVYTSAELAIGKYPNLVPTFNNLEWTSYQNDIQNFTIDAWDPAFDGGHNCGPNQDDVCELYIGVTGYCVNATGTVDFSMDITLSYEDGVYGETVAGQTIAPNGQNTYKICVNTNTSAFVYLSTNRDACECPSNYTNLQMSVSKTQALPSLNDYVWRLADVPSDHTIPLLVTDKAVRPGSYYVNVYGDCSEPTECFDPCDCAPCSHLQHTRFALYSGPYSNINQTSYRVNDACAAQTSTSVCADVCQDEGVVPPPSSGSSSNSRTLSGGAIAGIVIAVVFVAAVAAAVIFFALIRKRSAGRLPDEGAKADNDDQEMNSAFKNSVQE